MGRRRANRASGARTRVEAGDAAARVAEAAHATDPLHDVRDRQGLGLWPVVPLLAVGLLLWGVVLRFDWGGAAPVVLVAAALAAGTIHPVRTRVAAGLDRLRHPRPATARWAALGIGVGAAGYLFITAWWQASDLTPLVPDEFSYLIQTRMLARGRLWMGPHPADVRPFFDSVNLLVDPAYGSMYFPGTALIHLPAVAGGLPYWVTSLAVAGAAAGVLYRVVLDLIDGVYAAVAVVLLLGLSMFRALAVMLLSQSPMLLMGLLLMLAYGRWRRGRDWQWAAAVGGLAGWAGVTRPADALCYAVPVGLAMLLDLRRPAADGETGPPGPTRSAAPVPRLPMAETPQPHWRSVTVTLACLVLPALPFLAAQIVQNIGMTGHWWEFPEARYADENYPAPMLGFHHYDEATWHRPALDRKRLVSETFEQSFYRFHEPHNIPLVWREVRLPETLRYGLPHPLLAVLLPVGLLGLTSRPRRVLAAVVGLFLAFYTFYVFYIPHYMVVLAPGLILLVLLGARRLEEGLAARAATKRTGMAVAVPLAVAAAGLGSFPELHPESRDQAMFPAAGVVAMERRLSDLTRQLGADGRAIVLYRADLRTYLAAGEPVYNADVAWPDDATVVRANDLGPRNPALFRYFAVDRREPDRAVFRYDAATDVLTRLGTAGELADRSPPRD